MAAATARFLNHPAVRWLPDGRLELTSELRYVDGTGRLWIVPAGRKTDLASVPRIVPGVVRLLFRDRLANASAAMVMGMDLIALSRRSRSERPSGRFKEAVAP